MAAKLGVEPCALEAVRRVESNGDGFLPDGQPKILFEGHVFWRELKKRGLNPENYVEGNKDILYPKWTRQFYKGDAGEYARLERARAIDREAADRSTSWGAFQIMGNNYRACGYKTLAAFVEAMGRSASEHLRAACGFIRTNKLDGALRDKDWEAFARGYNGPGYADNQYNVRLNKAYTDCVALRSKR
ncbi:MAG: N-acetylmuramidase family protein [Desulfovibrio sp.]|jgi:hypothetical protein|nr:N-acetylmuramidase family protein [Desulfovibrio sp.]